MISFYNFRVAYTKEFGSSTIMSESKSYKPKKPDDVTDQLGSLSISNQSSSTTTSSTTPIVVSDREIYIPEEVRSFALTSGCYTMTTSRSKPAETVTTDSKRDQNWKNPTLCRRYYVAFVLFTNKLLLKVILTTRNEKWCSITFNFFPNFLQKWEVQTF